MRVAVSLGEMSPRGGPKFTLDLGKYLVGVGHDVTIVAEREGAWWPEVAARGMSGYCLPERRHARFVRLAEELSADLNSRAYDVIVVNVSPQNRLAQCAIHMVADRTPVLYVLHGDWSFLYSHAATDVAAWNCAVGVSPKVHRGAVAWFPGKPVVGISNGVELPTEADLLTRVGWELPLRLLFVGRLIDSHKGILMLPKILAGCRRLGVPVLLSVIGDGPDRERLVRGFEEEGVSDLVHLAGDLPPEDVAAAMRQHHVLVFPTNAEGMPLVVLEAQANGCVVVTTALPGVTDVAVEHGVTGRLVALGAVEDFVAHTAAVGTAAVWESHSRAAIARARRKFSLSAMGDRYVRLLEALVQGKYPIERPYNQGRKRSAVPFGSMDYIPPIVSHRIPPSLLRGLGQVKRGLRRVASMVRGGDA